MELRHLRYFVTVVEEQSITKAAEKLCIAQPPLSRQIQKLEEELGITLFERGSRPVKTTEAGMFFYEHAVQILTHTAQATSMARRINAVDKTDWLCQFIAICIIAANHLFISTALPRHSCGINRVRNTGSD